MRHSSPSVRLLASALAWFHLAWAFPTIAAVPSGADPGSVAIVSSVSGEALVRHADDPNQPNPASFKGPVVYGDRVTTSKDSTLGLLLGEKSLLTVLELSAVEIKQTGEGGRLVEMVNGKVCLATAKIKAGPSGSTVVRTPTTTVTAQPGSLFQIEVQQGTAGAARETGPDPVEPAPAARPYLASLIAQAGPKAAQAGAPSGTPTIEIFSVIEGSIDIVSQAASAAATPVRVQAGRAVRVVNGKIGEPYEAPPVTCRVQDLQQAPVHTSIPGGARDTITQRETEQAEILVAMVDKPPQPPAPLDKQDPPPGGTPGGVVLPTTRLYAFGGPAIPPPVFPPPPDPVLVFQGAILDMSIPLVRVTDPPNTSTGPATLFELNGFKGNNANVPLGLVGLNIFNLNEYRNPDNPQILQASIQVRSTSGVDVPIVHGVSFTNSTVAPAPGYTGPVVQIEDSKVTAFTPAQPGILVRLSGSQLTSNDFLLHQNTNPVNTTTLNGTLLQAEQGSQVTVNGTFANVDPSTIIVNGSLLTLIEGSTLSTTGPFIDLTSSTLTGNTAPIVNVNGGTLNLGSAGSPAGLARLNNSTLTANAGLLSISGGGVVNSSGVLASLVGTSTLTATGNLITLSGTGNLTAGGIVNATGGSTVTTGGSLLSASGGTFAGTGTLVTLANSSLTITGAVPAITAVSSLTIINGGLLNATSSTFTSASAGPSLASIGPGAGVVNALVNMHGGSTLSSAGTLIQLSGTNLTIPNANALVGVTGAGSQLTITGGDLLALRNGSTLVGLGTTQEILSVPVGATASISGNLLTLDNVAFPARSAPILTVTDAPETNTNVTIGGAVASLSNGSTLSVSTGLVNVLNTNTVGKILSLGSFATVQSGSTLNVSNHLASISNSTVTLTGSGPAVSVNAGTLTVTTTNGGRDLVNLSNSTLTAPNGLLAVTNGGTVTINRHLVAMNPSTFNVTNGLLALSGGSTVTMGGLLASVPAGSTLAATGTLVTSSASTLNVNGAGAAVAVGTAATIGSNASLTIAGGGLLSANGGTLTINPLLAQVTGGTGAAGAGAVSGSKGGDASLTAGATLSALTGVTFNSINGGGITVLGGTGGAYTGGTGTSGVGGNATLIITGAGLLTANGGSMTISSRLAQILGGEGGASTAVAGIGGNASLTAGSTLITLTNGATLRSGGIEVAGGLGGVGDSGRVASGAGNLSVTGGGLLSANGGSVRITSDFVTVNGNLQATGVLVNLSNMTGANPASFADHLISISNPTATFCTTPPCSRAPGVLQATDVGTVASPITVGGSVLALDLALFEATAPLINMIRSHLQASSLVTLANNASYLSSNAAIDFVSLNAGSINTSGALVNMAGGTFNVAGNFVSLANGSTLTANTLAFLTGGSFNVGGALVALTGVGNTLTINANCGAACITFGVNVPILFQNGANLANTAVTIPAAYNAFAGSLAGNTLPGLTKPLLIVDGPTAKAVKLGP